jgi:anti-sigma-K factor RskA
MSDPGSTSSSGDRIDDLLALAALGELTEAEERELDAALVADVTLQDELDSDLDTAARLQGVNAESPSPGLKHRVMEAIDAPVAVGDELGERRDRRRSRWLPLAAAAAVAFLAVAGIVLVRNGDANDDDVVAAVLEASDLQERPFDGELAVSLTAFYSPAAGALVVDGLDVEPVDEGETYQLWLVGESGAESIGLFRPDDDGRVLVAFAGADPGDLPLGITVEPAGGSDQPTQEPLATTT